MINRNLFLVIFLVLEGCVFYNMQHKGVFKKPYNKYKIIEYSKNPLKESVVILPDNTKISFRYLGGNCGASVDFTGIIIPIIPSFTVNTCEYDGFEINYSVLEKKTMQI